MPDALLALNAGSSSIKFGLFGMAAEGEPALILKGSLEDQGPTPKFIAIDPKGATLEEHDWSDTRSHEDLLGFMLDWIDRHLGGNHLAGVGHRIVHGGVHFSQPTRLTDDIISAIDALTPLAPLHQPRSLEPIRALQGLRPYLPQVGCFDTAFHHDLAPPVSRYAIPLRFEAEGVRKYGFHGLSFEYIASTLGSLDPALPSKRTVVAHLGNGSSLCATRNGRSLDTTMGFSTLDGLVMGTRCGAIDPGVLLYLQKTKGMSAEALEQMLYHGSGMLGVSGISGDMRALSASEDPRAKEAIELFVFRIAREALAMANTLGGIDALVFTGGIGEHAPHVRAMVCDRLAWLGAQLDSDANGRASRQIHAPGSKIDIYIVPTDEERVMARHTQYVLRPGR
jgi:acetate kinase